MKITQAVSSLAALAQATRLGVYRLLVEHGQDGLPAGVIATRLSVPAATLSFHLKELAQAKLVVARQEGRFVYYAADFGAMTELMEFLTEHCCADDAGECAPAQLVRRRQQGSGQNPHLDAAQEHTQ
ncbi:MAG: metalloregulator ArsR/SmtB family transcription factor [Gemmatimonadota bacterium]